jgi:hypothetical protein
MRLAGWLTGVLALTAAPAFSQEYVNGYTYVAPSYYLSPPVVTVYEPVVPLVAVRPAPVVITPRPMVVGPPVIGYAPPPVVVRERVRVRPSGVVYRSWVR